MTQVKAIVAAFMLFLFAGFSTVATAADSNYATGDIAMGKEDAPVTIIEYASMTCSHCAHFHNDIFKDFKAKYIDTGKVRMIFREFPFDQYALQASMLARCVGKDRYFPMVEVLFRQQGKWLAESPPTEGLRKIARLGGVSQEAFDACMSDKALEEQILMTRLNGNKEFGVDSTPSFIVNGDLYSGAMEMPEWDKILAKYL